MSEDKEGFGVVAVIGLGYVGLPLALALAKGYAVVGYDVDKERVNELARGVDRTHEVSSKDLQEKSGRSIGENHKIYFTADAAVLGRCSTYIVTVPTPIDANKVPDLVPLVAAAQAVGKVMQAGALVIFESTVYPGCTEEVCVPALEGASGLKLNKNFWVGYSPERINPGDKVHTLTHIKKVTSGSSAEAAERVDRLYRSIIVAGTHLAPSIKVAEASKAIENAQRDLNISFMNELALLFDRMGIDTQDVLDAAKTKWNFLPFQPGLVGGNCISVDPYYLTYKAQALGYTPQVILSGRRVNDQMGEFVAHKVIKLMIQKGHAIHSAKVLLLGFTFKENCPDIRNTRAIDIYKELISFGVTVEVHDPWADPKEVQREYGISLKMKLEDLGAYQGVIIAVAHSSFMEIDFSVVKAQRVVIFDTKSCINRNLVDGRL